MSTEARIDVIRYARNAVIRWELRWLTTERTNGRLVVAWTGKRNEAATFTPDDAELVAGLVLDLAEGKGKFPTQLSVETVPATGNGRAK